MYLVRILFVIFLLGMKLASAQTNPGFVSGQPLTAAQLNSAFVSKSDYPYLGPIGTSITGQSTGSVSSPYNYNFISVLHDDLNAANNIVSGLYLEYGFGGMPNNSNTQGARDGLNIYMHQDGTTNASNPNPFYTGINVNIESFQPDTSNSALTAGNYFALLQTGVTGFHSVAGEQTASGMYSSGGASYRLGINVESIGLYQGGSGDYAIVIGAGNNAGVNNIGWLNGIFLSHFNGLAPLDTNGCVICTDANNDTIATGMDLSAYTISGNFLKGPGNFSVSGTGQLIAGIISAEGPVSGAGSYVNVNNQDAVHNSELAFYAAGVVKWEFGKNGSGNFFIYDDVGAQNVITVNNNSNMTLSPKGGTTAITGTLTVSAITAGTAADVLCYASSTGVITYETTGTTCTVSALEYKNLIGFLENTNISKLRPAIWTYKHEMDLGDKVHVGLLADDVEALDPRCATYDKEGKLQNYEDRCVMAYLVAELQKIRRGQ